MPRNLLPGSLVAALVVGLSLASARGAVAVGNCTTTAQRPLHLGGHRPTSPACPKCLRARNCGDGTARCNLPRVAQKGPGSLSN
jgi:hypothetical protein